MKEDRDLPTWCMTCGTSHGLSRVCPGSLPATGEEREGWSILAATPRGRERYEVLLAPSYELWRARIRTFPNVLWLAPGLRTSLKFVGPTRIIAEHKAIEFIEQHCRSKGIPMQREASALWSEPEAPARDQPATRKIRFLPIRFGLTGPSEDAGTGNLSETGMFVVTDAPVEPGTRLRLVLDVAKSRLPLVGQVRWRRTANEIGGVPGMGIQLLEPPRPYVEFVRKLD